MIIDAHVHIVKLHDSPFAEMSLEQIRNALLREMKANRVDHALILASHGKETVTIDTPLDTILKLTENISNLHAVGSVDILRYTKSYLARLDLLFRSKKIVAMKLYPGYQYFYPGDKRCDAIYKLCSKYDVPVIFHSGDTLSIPGQPAKIKYSHPLHIDDVATNFPKLKIIIAHLGNPWMIDAAEVLYKNPNVYADISGLVVGESLRSPYGALMQRRINELIIYSGSERKLLFGTDWPLISLGQYISFAKRLGLSKENQKYLFYKNAANLFKLNI